MHEKHLQILALTRLQVLYFNHIWRPKGATKKFYFFQRVGAFQKGRSNQKNTTREYHRRI